MKILNLLLFFSYISIAQFSITTDYYANLIQQRTTDAENYELPTSNEEFLPFNTVPIDIGLTYDFIIIGGGTAGSVLATRLSEINDFSILLLEAGDNEDDFSDIPAMFFHLQFGKMNWGYFTTPQKNCCLGMNEQKCFVPRGKALGGSSSINAMMYVRGNPKDYDKWEEMGNPGWSYEEVLPYFLKSENSQINGDDGYHNQGGYWNVEFGLPKSKYYDTFFDASNQINISVLDDFNGQTQLGSSPIQYNIKNGKRQSLNTAFLHNAKKRQNLDILRNSYVIKILINSENKTAEGVEFVYHEPGSRGYTFVAKANKEIILSGGAFNSPQLLMLSGIGPAEHLKEMEIDVIADLPVGKNLMDHPMFPGLIFRTNQTINSNFETEIEELLEGLGSLTKPASIEGIGFIKTDDIPESAPAIEFLYATPSGKGSTITTRAFNYGGNLTDYFTTMNASTDFQLYVVLLHEKSRGSITLKSNNYIDFPNIDLNMFDEQEDIDTFIDGIDFVLRLTKTEAFQRLNPQLLDFPICGEFIENSKEFWECVLRHMSATLYHPCGTTAMGSNTTTSVVDHNLKVHGIEKLRVVDAGIFPSTITGHTMAPVVVVAEKIADVIKNDYGYY